MKVRSLIALALTTTMVTPAWSGLPVDPDGMRVYDRAGRLAAVTLAAGTVFRYSYVSIGREVRNDRGILLATEHYDGTVEAYRYDANGRKVETRITKPGAEPRFVTHAAVPPSVGEATGLQYHRERWYDPRTGRFVSGDPFDGVDDDPATLHDYSYAAQDPVNKSDPTGLFVDTGSQVQAAGLQAGLQTAASIPQKTVAAVVATTLATSGILTSIKGLPAPPGNIPPKTGNNGDRWVLFRLMTATNPLDNFISSKDMGYAPAGPEKMSDSSTAACPCGGRSRRRGT